MLYILRVHEVQPYNRDHLQKKDCTALKTGETSFQKEEKKSLSKDLKLQMVESDGSYNTERSTADEVALMSKNFKHMMKKKWKF